MSEPDDHASDSGASGNGAEARAVESEKPQLPKRFYDQVDTVPAETGYSVHLDERSLKTPMRNALVVPSQALADGIAREWSEQREVIDPATMSLTRLTNSTIDGVIPQQSDVIEDIVKYAGHDLICYRAEGPQTLTERQRQVWDPILAWAQQHLGASWVCCVGVMPVEQPEATASAVRAALNDYNPFQLAALHEITSLTGSALLALAYGAGHMDIDAVWRAAHLDETFQAEQWGADPIAVERRMGRQGEAAQADQFFRLASSQSD